MGNKGMCKWPSCSVFGPVKQVGEFHYCLKHAPVVQGHREAAQAGRFSLKLIVTSLILVFMVVGCGSNPKPAPTQLTITTKSLASAIVGQPYNTILSASGGNPPYTWTIISGSLPSGLSLSLSGIISGQATVVEVSSFTIQVTDSTLSSAFVTVKTGGKK